MTTSPAPLDLTGRLLVTEPGGETFPVEGRGGSIHVRLPDLRAALRLRRDWGTLPPRPRALVERSGVVVEVTVGRWITARWVPGSSPGVAARLFGWAPFQLSLGRRLATHGANA